ncbi:hypothetical protein LSUE1_G004240, partial [Lachnellula suecica]
MGQEQSAPSPRRQNKLSKPRTNSSGNLISKIPGTPSRQNSQSNNNASPTKSRNNLLLSNDAGIGEAGEKKEEKQRKRMSLFRSKSSQAKSVIPPEFDTTVQTNFVDPSPVELPVRRHSRTNSVTFEEQATEVYQSRPTNRSRMSLQHFPYQQHHARLSLVSEARSQEPEKEVGSNPLSRFEEEDPQNPLPRTNSESALYGPIRRRSLLQHGVATRKSLFPQNDSRQSLPSQISANNLQNYYHNPAKPASSPLSELAALGRVGNGSPGPRVDTPTDLEYGHTGVFKLGSLRITNGAASPAPSEGRPLTAGVEEDYLTMGARRNGESNQRHGLGQRSNTYAAPNESVRPPWIARSESPLRQEVAEEALTIDTQLPLPDPSFALFDFSSRDSPTKSLDLAKQYMEDLALSPFSFDDSPPSSPTLQATSKHMAIEDDLFEPEPISPNPGVLEHAPRSFDSGYGTAETTKVVQGPRELAIKPLAKADSGYSSNISLRSFKKDFAPTVPAKEAPPTPPKETFSRVPSSTYSVASQTASRVPSSTYSVSSQASEITLRARRSLPALPTEEYIPPPPMREAPAVPPKHSDRSPGNVSDYRTISQTSPPHNWGAPNRPSSANHHKHAHQHSLPTIPRAIRETPVLREKASNSDESVSPNSSKWRSSKVQKQRPHSVQPTPVYTVQAMRTPSETFSIPPVPVDVSRKLEERVDGFPVTSFPNTIAGTTGLRRNASKETLGTIFSVGSAEVRDELNFARLQSALPPVPVHASIPEYAPRSPEQKPDFNRRNTYQPASSTQTPPRKPLLRPWSMSREQSPAPRQSMEQQQDDYETHVTSLDAVSSSLGSSPYDAAIATMRPQSSDANARAKSVTSQFEAEASARFQQRARNVSGTSSILQNKKSYESMAGGNPFASGANTASHSRKSSREYPPQAHSKISSKRSFTFVPAAPQTPPRHLQNQMSEQDSSRVSVLLRESTRKSSPPVSMQTQRKSLPAPRASSVAAAPERAAPQPPAPSPTGQASWAKPANFWAERRKSAGEALRTSMEMSRPGSARPSVEYQRPVQNLRAYGSFDQVQRDGWEAEHAKMQQGYDHTFGAPHFSEQVWDGNKENEYYDQEDSQLEDFTPPRNHARTNSTEGMLVLD